MGDVVRQAYVISDLHLGGVYASPGDKQDKKSDRGFRICTHAKELAQFIDSLTAKPVDAPAIELIINGDLVDFLAERDPDDGTFTSFCPKQSTALKKLQAIISRDQIVFDAFGRFLARGHRLVILLGNHDIELAMPGVRAELARAIGATRGADFTFVPGIEAYMVGDALIEHGNRYDAWNIVDHEALQRVSAALSRKQRPAADAFVPPPGSEMVAQVINPIKEQYKFVDLLKPETGAVVPLLLTLEPGFRRIMAKVALLASRARNAVRVKRGGDPYGSDISSGDTGGSIGSDISSGGFDSPVMGSAPSDGAEGALDALLNEELGAEAHTVRNVIDGAAGSENIGSDISTFGEIVDRTVGIAKLFVARSGSHHRERLDALLAAFRSLQDDRTFDESHETGQEYLDAATGLATNGVKHVVFGHTHMAKRIPLPSGGFYLNSGTWADVMEFPRDVVTGEREVALPRLDGFVQDLVDGNFGAYALFRPTYVRLDLSSSGAVTPELCRYSDPAQV